MTDAAPNPTWVSVYGGKLTGYRHTGQRTLGLIAPTLGPATRLADTETLRLPELERVDVWD